MEKVKVSYIKTEQIYGSSIEVELQEEVKISYNGDRKVLHTGWSEDDERQEWLNYLYDNCGEDCMRTFLAENGTMGVTRKSSMVGSNGYSDYGICQINVGYHPEVLAGEGYGYGSGKYFQRWFYNPYRQMDKCIELWNGGTVFYAYNSRFDRTKAIIIF